MKSKEPTVSIKQVEGDLDEHSKCLVCQSHDLLGNPELVALLKGE